MRPLTEPQPRALSARKAGLRHPTPTERKEKAMFIGGGAIVFILVVVVIIMLIRRS
jgi:hypothetical protein